MADEYDVNILVYMIFDEEFLNSKEMLLRKSTIPTCLFAKEFYERMQSVLFIRRQITFRRWQSFFDTCFKQMLSSHEMYLTFVMFACIREDECHKNKFDSFLSVCSLVKFLSDETLQKSGVNFCDLNPDIFMTFYDNHLKKVFNKSGGFRRLVEYILGHRFLRWIDNWGDLAVLPDDPTMDNCISPDCPTQRYLDKKIEKELRRERRIEKETNPDEVATHLTSIALAMEVLSITQGVPPSLPSQLDLIKSMNDYTIKKMAKYSEGKRAIDVAEKLESVEVYLNGCSGSNSDYKTHCAVKHQENIKRHGSIIEAVIRHNNSTSSSNKNMNSRIQEEAEVLEHLKDMTESLNEILDKFKNE